MTDAPENRRPLRSRTLPYVPHVTRWLLARGATPNFLSGLSIVAASVAAASLLALPASSGAGTATGFGALALASILLRAMCNMFDGLLAIEGGLKSASGEVWNDVPDRISDLLMFVAAGYAAAQPHSAELGWAAASLAILTAYVRQLGGAQGLKQDFGGPMPKPKRFLILALGTVAMMVEAWASPERLGTGMVAALCVISGGCVWTFAVRLRGVVRELETR